MTTTRAFARRPAAERVPQHTEAAATAAARRIHRRRAAANDPDLAFYPLASGDDPVSEEDLDGVVRYLERHNRLPAHVRDDVRRAELGDRAVIVEYLHQREVTRYERRMLSVLEAGLQLGASPATVGGPFGLLSRQHVWVHRRRLAVRHRLGGDAPPTRRERERTDTLAAWLATHNRELRDVAGMLVDHQDTLLPLLPDSGDRTQLAEAITQAGASLATRTATSTLAGAVAYALFFLRPDGPAGQHPDPIVRDGLATGVRLRADYKRLTE